MSAPATAQRTQGPRWILGGRWRRNVHVASLWWALAPALVLVLVALVLAVVVSPWLLVVALVAGVGVSWWRPVRSWWRRRWWLAEWYFSARAGGLGLDAEPSWFPGTDAPLDKRIVVVPRVKITLTATGRRYRVKPLPSQVIGDFEQAAQRLAVRWRASSVRVEYAAGSKFVTLAVDTLVPRSTRWEAPR